MRTTYWVSSEGDGFLNPGERPLYSLVYKNGGFE